MEDWAFRWILTQLPPFSSLQDFLEGEGFLKTGKREVPVD